MWNIKIDDSGYGQVLPNACLFHVERRNSTSGHFFIGRRSFCPAWAVRRGSSTVDGRNKSFHVKHHGADG